MNRTPKTAESPKTYNYAKNKQGWVTFKDGKPKMKLRKYISDLAVRLNTMNKKGFSYNRDKLIECYNIDGLRGISAAAIVLMEETKQPKVES